MKVKPKIGSHQVNPQGSAKKDATLTKILSRSLVIQSKGVRKSSYSSKVPNDKESQKITRTASRLFSKQG